MQHGWEWQGSTVAVVVKVRVVDVVLLGQPVEELGKVRVTTVVRYSLAQRAVVGAAATHCGRDVVSRLRSPRKRVVAVQQL